MFKSLKVFMNKTRKDNSTNSAVLRSKAIADISKLISTNIVDMNDILEFEVSPKRVSAVLAVIDKPPLSDKYIIMQSPDVLTLFQARVRQLEV